MSDATFNDPDLTTFTGLDELGLVAIGQRLEPGHAVLECRVLTRVDDAFCRRCGAEGVVRDTVTRGLAHEPFGWRPTMLLVRHRFPQPDPLHRPITPRGRRLPDASTPSDRMSHEFSSGTKHLRHPLVGELYIEYATFPVPEEPDQQLFLYTAKKGTPSADALRILATWHTDDALTNTTARD